MPAMAPEERLGPLTGSTTNREVAEDGASAAGWSRAARTALDARDASVVSLAGRARAAREVVSTGPRHRVTALYTSGTAESMH